jgi:hypothetical protein
LSANGDHNLTNITYNDILLVTDTDHDLWILGEAADNVTFAASNGWTSGSSVTETINGASHTFVQWTNSNDGTILVKVESVI